MKVVSAVLRLGLPKNVYNWNTSLWVVLAWDQAQSWTKNAKQRGENNRRKKWAEPKYGREKGKRSAHFPCRFFFFLAVSIRSVFAFSPTAEPSITKAMDNTSYYLTGYQGKNCEENIDECASDPSQNEGTCVDSTGTYDCICPNGFYGKNCEEDIDECRNVEM